MATTTRKPVPPAEAVTTSNSVVDVLEASVPGIIAIPITQLAPHPRNPRGDLGDLTELADSIKAVGIRQPLLVVPNTHATITNGDPWPLYTVVIGHRRMAAAALAGLTVVPATIDEHLDEAEQLQLMLIENLQRTDLTPFEEAHAYQDLLDLGLTVAKIVKATGRSRQTVERRISLQDLAPVVEASHAAHVITLEEAILLADLKEEVPSQYADIVRRLDEGSIAEWVMNVARQELKVARARAALTAQAQAEGITIHPGHASLWGDKPVATLAQLKLKPAAHATCKGHAYVINGSDTPKLKLVCTDPKKHHRTEFKAAYDKSMGGSSRPEKETPEQKARKEHLAALANDLGDAKQLRRMWLAAVMRDPKSDARKELTSRAATNVLEGLLDRGVLQTIPDHVELPAGADLVVLGELLAADALPHGSYELIEYTRTDRLKRDKWFAARAQGYVDYLVFLEKNGYTLSDAETTLRDELRTALAAATDTKAAKKS